MVIASCFVFKQANVFKNEVIYTAIPEEEMWWFEEEKHKPSSSQS